MKRGVDEVRREGEEGRITCDVDFGTPGHAANSSVLIEQCTWICGSDILVRTGKRMVKERERTLYPFGTFSFEVRYLSSSSHGNMFELPSERRTPFVACWKLVVIVIDTRQIRRLALQAVASRGPRSGMEEGLRWGGDVRIGVVLGVVTM